MTAWPLLESVVSGETADIYFVRAVEVLKAEGLDPWPPWRSSPAGGASCVA